MCIKRGGMFTYKRYLNVFQDLFLPVLVTLGRGISEVGGRSESTNGAVAVVDARRPRGVVQDGRGGDAARPMHQP